MTEGIKLGRRWFLGHSLEKLIEPIYQDTETIVFPRQHIITFGLSIEDYNDVHLDPETAAEYGFTDTPLIGVQIAAHGEHFLRKQVRKLEEQVKRSDVTIRINRLEVRFPKAAYPEEEIVYRITEHETERGDKNALKVVHLTGSSFYTEDLEGKKERKEKVVLKVAATLGEEYSATPKLNNAAFERSFSLSEKKVKKFYRGAVLKDEDRIPYMLPAGYITSALIELLRVKTLEKSGTNMRMSFDILSEIRAEIPIKVEIWPLRKNPSKRDGGYVYNIEALATQKETPIMYGEILCSTKNLISF